MSISLYRCAACGSRNVVTDTTKEGYSYTKGAIGTVVFGAGGAVAGVNGKEKRVFKCPDCGVTLNYSMPYEMQILIDMGVSSLSARNNLKLRGVPMEWDYLKNKYKNIESGAADKAVAEEKQSISNILNEKATATKEEFDYAVDMVSEFKEIIKSSDNKGEQITKDQYQKYLNSLKLIIENCIKFLPPETLKKSEFYNGKEIELRKLFSEYLAILYFEKTGKFLIDPEIDISYLMDIEPLVSVFIETYTDVLGWRRIFGDYINFDLFTIDFVEDLYFDFILMFFILISDDEIGFRISRDMRMKKIAYSKSYLEVFLKNLNETLKKLKVDLHISNFDDLLEIFGVIMSKSVYMPRYVVFEDKLYKTAPIKNKRFRNVSGWEYAVQFLNEHPERKEDCETLVFNRIKEMLSVGDLEKQITSVEKSIKKSENRKIKYQQECKQIESNIEELNTQIYKLERKIFGKAKAQQQITELREKIDSMNANKNDLLKKIEDIPQSISDFKNNIQEIKAKIEAINDSEYMFWREFLDKLNYFVDWQICE